MPKQQKQQEPEKSPPTQHREFVRAARKLGVEESVEAFDTVLKRIACAPAEVAAEAQARQEVKLPT